MSSKVTGWAWDQDLAVQRKCVLLWLAERATDNGLCFPGQNEIRQKTGLSESMVRRYLHWLAADRDDGGAPKQPLVRIIQRPIAGDRNTSNVYVLLVPWALPGDVRRELEELKYVPKAVLRRVGCTGEPQGDGERGCAPVGGTGAPQVGGTGAREEPSLPDPDRELPPVPPEVQQQGELLEVPRPGVRPGPSPGPGDDDSAQTLASAFYRGLDADVEGVTLAIRRRDMAIARQLVAASATPAEAEAYAREASAASGRIAPVDLRSFERERLGWLARRRERNLSVRQVVDRTGLPPSWQTEQRAIIEDKHTSGVLGPQARPKPETAPGAANRRDLTSDQLGEKLRTLLRGGEGQ